MYAVIDVETTGGKPSVHRITEIAILIHDGRAVVERFESLVNPEQPIPYFITQLTGISNRMVREAPKFREIAPRILELTDGKVFVAHNARFDYSFLKQEFLLLGQAFQRKTLCTVRTSRRVFPGFASYSLGKLCYEMGIAHHSVHRAGGDADATAELLTQIVAAAGERVATEFVQEECGRGEIPPSLIPKLDSLPDAVGVYQFKNSKGQTIYVGKSRDIRSGVLSHLRGDSGTSKPINFKNEVADVEYEITGDDLIAQLKESESIKNLQPKFNRTLKRKHFDYGLYVVEENGYLSLRVRSVSAKGSPVHYLPSRAAGERLLEHLCENFQLCLRLCYVHKYQKPCRELRTGGCLGACEGKEPSHLYNQRVRMMVKSYKFSDPNFLVLGVGRQENERSFVCVREGELVGYGYLEPGQEHGYESVMVPAESHPESRVIVLRYLKNLPATARVLRL